MAPPRMHSPACIPPPCRATHTAPLLPCPSLSALAHKLYNVFLTAPPPPCPSRPSQVWVKPSAELQFLYGNHVLKSGLGRITEATPGYTGVVVYSMSGARVWSLAVQLKQAGCGCGVWLWGVAGGCGLSAVCGRRLPGMLAGSGCPAVVGAQCVCSKERQWL